MTQDTALSILKLGHTAFLTGAAGAGKSYVLRAFVKYLKEHGVPYAVTASTGIAATHINGTTIHSWSGIGIKERLTAYELEALEEKQPLYKKWTTTQVLIIDEVSMLHATFLETLDSVAKHMRRNDEPFGGLQVVFTGDFFQLPPVTKNFNGEDDAVFAFQSRAWVAAKPVVCYLTEQYRQGNDGLSDVLNAIRDGEITESHYEILEGRVGKKGHDDYIKLYTHNENVDRINEEAFARVKGEERQYEMITKGKGVILEGLKKNCLADELLTLKIGAKVICIKNAQDRSYVNGSMGTVVSFNKEGSPVVELVNGKKVTIVADSWKIEEDGKVKAELQQLPLKLAWAITVHKSQGMTLDNAHVDLSRAFASGQGYVALSRLRSLEGLYLEGFNPQALQISSVVRDNDELFRARSTQAEQALAKYSAKQVEEMHNAALLEKGGSIEVVSYELDSDDAISEKVPSHEITKEMLASGKTLEEIAKERDLTIDTIIGHIEKLCEVGEDLMLDHVLPKDKDFVKIAKAFEQLETRKLTPVFDHVGGKVTYHDIRIVRAYLRI
jgi:ATP-dependent exoDNAse (exonuclease V) alpha subunit